MSDINFLIIGAQKAGTTSLFEYMRRHPDIHMPAEKEIAFFEWDQAYQRGFDWYSSRVTRGAPAGTICGTASVGYMTGTPYRGVPLEQWGSLKDEQRERLEDIIPQRIRDALPDVKLICVLRDPVERTISHYRMAVLDGVESRPLRDAIERLLEPRALDHARAVADGHNGYVARSEYGRIIAGYLRAFRRDQLKVVFSRDLLGDPAGTVAEIFDFVGATPDFVPDNIEERYRTGSTRQRIRGLNLYLLRARLAQVQLAKALWYGLSRRSRDRISEVADLASYRLDLWNARRDQPHEEVDPDIRARLQAHFRPDCERLTEMLAVRLPWLERWDERERQHG